MHVHISLLSGDQADGIFSVLCIDVTTTVGIESNVACTMHATLFNYYDVCVSSKYLCVSFPPPSLSFYPSLYPLCPFFPPSLPSVLPSSILTDLSETGRMLSTALSDGYLAMHDTRSDLSPHHHQLSASLDGRHFGQALDDHLFPPLTQNDRHPSAPQLVSMLTDNKADVMLQDDMVGPLY